MRLIAGLAIALALAPALPPLPAIPAVPGWDLTVIVEQILIGVMLGFALRITFAAVDVAGELIGLQMGLSFATFFDPGGGQTPVITEFLGLLTALVFLAMNGHLLALTWWPRASRCLPVGTTPIQALLAR
jgi:flagellar biosynthetic protein FliR